MRTNGIGLFQTVKVPYQYHGLHFIYTEINPYYYMISIYFQCPIGQTKALLNPTHPPQKKKIKKIKNKKQKKFDIFVYKN